VVVVVGTVAVVVAVVLVAVVLDVVVLDVDVADAVPGVRSGSPPAMLLITTTSTRSNPTAPAMMTGLLTGFTTPLS
jgi:hypothetical protein